MYNSIKQKLCIMFNPFSFIFHYLMIKVCLSSAALSDCLRIPLWDLMRGWGILFWHYLYLLMKCLISAKSPGPGPKPGEQNSRGEKLGKKWEGPKIPESITESWIERVEKVQLIWLWYLLDADVSELEVKRLLDTTEKGAAVSGGRRRPGTRRARPGRERSTSRRAGRRGSHS